ncbi:hypothetical protein ACOSP7_022030 [Xanthoceras sorbifolium]
MEAPAKENSTEGDHRWNSGKADGRDNPNERGTAHPTGQVMEGTKFFTKGKEKLVDLCHGESISSKGGETPQKRDMTLQNR